MTIPPRVKDLTGQVFGRLTVIEFAGANKHGQSLWLCSCSCGGVKTVARQNLSSGNSQSCGCSQIRVRSELAAKSFRYACPYSKDRLWEMYWGLSLSLDEIAIHAGTLMGIGRAISKSVVKRWMDQFGLNLRDRSEQARLLCSKAPRLMVKFAAAGAAATRGVPNLSARRFSSRETRRGVVNSAKCRAQQCWEMRSCSWCRRAVARKRSRFCRDTEHTYCSSSCAAKAFHASVGHNVKDTPYFPPASIEARELLAKVGAA